MDIAEIEKLTSLLGSVGFGAILGGGILYQLLKNYFPSYLTEKAKNLATKEDIENITDKVESVKTGYLKLIEELKSNNQLKLAEIEREKNLKKEVYLDAVEALTKTLNVISSLANLEISDQSISSGMANESGKIAKVQIVGSEKTVKSVTTIMSAIGTTILELMLERAILVGRKNKIALIEGFRTKANNEIERYISIMSNLNLEGNFDKQRWETLNNFFEFETKKRDEFTLEINSLVKAQSYEHIAFLNKCISKYFQITALLPDAVLAIRDELNLAISNEAYVDIFNKSIEEGKHVFAVFLENVSKMLNEQSSQLT